MSEMPTVTIKEFCPLGRECVEVIGNERHVCKWHIDFTTTKPDGKTVNVQQCSMIWSPTLTVELLTMLRIMFDAMMKKDPGLVPKAYQPKQQ